MEISKLSQNIYFKNRLAQKVFKKSSDIILFEPVKFQHDIFGPLSVAIKNNSTYDKQDFIITLRNSIGKCLGFETLKICPQYNTIFGKLIKVEEEYSTQCLKKGFGFGELLRLFSVRTLLDNNLNCINIMSEKSAIYFHNKYKFEPNVHDFFDCRKLLRSIRTDKSQGFEDLSMRAKLLTDEITKGENNINRDEFFTKINVLLKDYLQKSQVSINSKKNHQLDSSIEMELSKDRVLQEKEFFNKLYKKHGINYKIEDN